MADFQNAMCNGEMLKCLFKRFSGQCGVGAQHFTASQYYFAINKLICQQRIAPCIFSLKVILQSYRQFERKSWVKIAAKIS